MIIYKNNILTNLKIKIPPIIILYLKMQITKYLTKNLIGVGVWVRVGYGVGIGVGVGLVIHNNNSINIIYMVGVGFFLGKRLGFSFLANFSKFKLTTCIPIERTILRLMRANLSIF